MAFSAGATMHPDEQASKASGLEPLFKRNTVNQDVIKWISDVPNFGGC